MKSVTEFAMYNLDRGIKAKTALAGEGKTPEEISESIGTTFKLEGDKLKYFLAAMDVAAANETEGLMRVLVVSLNEGESAPEKSTKVDEMTYIPEFKIQPKTKVTTKHDKKEQGRGKGGKQGPKESPWGLTPEQKAAKKAGGKAGAPPTT